MICRIAVDFLFVTTPCACTERGNCAIAAATRFWTSTCAKSGIGADLERHDERIVPVVRAGGLHVEHALDAVHLLLDWQRYRLDHGARARARDSARVTCTVGGVIGGYCEIGSWKIATPPSRTMRNAMTFARTGRSMKNLENTGLSVSTTSLA